MLWVAGLVAIVAAVAALLLWRNEKSAVREYVTVAADRGTVAPTVIASGTVNPVTTIQIGTYVSGVIQSLSCDFNTRVRAGQLCAKIDPRPYQTVVEQESAALATARAQLDKDRANLAFAKVILDRDSDLLKRNIVSQETVDTANNAYEQARTQIALDEAAVKQHQASLDAARINLGYTNIVSPVDGTVVSRNVTQGQTVAASFQTPTLFLIATDLTQMQVDTNVSESDIGRVQEANAATFTVESFPDRPFAGTVTQVRQAPQTVQNVVTYDVVVSVPNPEGVLKPGMTASVRIVTVRHDGALRVPSQALRYQPSGNEAEAAGGEGTKAAGAARPGRTRGREAVVWVLRDGRPQRVPVVTGLDDETFIEVLAGDLHAGDPVIVSERSGAAAHGQATSSAPRMPLK
ncbi:MAG TPA: efflux RND transporter periplasmic adaptor subunit [Burkholderiaceae bacterium]|nr:efflux RND transporter periplasmic adaptor subunit [Burkholderiaceae bacterium]